MRVGIPVSVGSVAGPPTLRSVSPGFLASSVWTDGEHVLAARPQNRLIPVFLPSYPHMPPMIEDWLKYVVVQIAYLDRMGHIQGDANA